MADSINWMQELEGVPEKAESKLAASTMQRFNSAVSWQSSEQVNGKPLRTVLQECWDQANGLPSCDEVDRAESLGVNVHINLTALKADIANAFLNDALTSRANNALPWIIQPTPRPDISLSAKERILIAVREGLTAGVYQNQPAEFTILLYVHSHGLHTYDFLYGFY